MKLFPHISTCMQIVCPFTTQYLDYLCASIKDALEIGLFGFTKPHANSLLPPVSYLSKPIDEFEGDGRNIAYFARIYNNLTLDYVKIK